MHVKLHEELMLNFFISLKEYTLFLVLLLPANCSLMILRTAKSLMFSGSINSTSTYNNKSGQELKLDAGKTVCPPPPSSQ